MDRGAGAVTHLFSPCSGYDVGYVKYSQGIRQSCTIPREGLLRRRTSQSAADPRASDAREASLCLMFPEGRRQEPAGACPPKRAAVARRGCHPTVGLCIQ